MLKKRREKSVLGKRNLEERGQGNFQADKGYFRQKWGTEALPVAANTFYLKQDITDEWEGASAFKLKTITFFKSFFPMYMS